MTLTNTGSVTLTISSIAVTGTNQSDFVQVTKCSATVSPWAGCIIGVTFKSPATGTRTATLTITDNATNSPQTVSLTGTGIAPAVMLSATSVTFATQLLHTTSPAQVVTLTNIGTATLTVTSVTLTDANAGDFA